MISSDTTVRRPFGNNPCFDRFQCCWIVPFVTPKNAGIAKNGTRSYLLWKNAPGHDDMASSIRLPDKQRVLDERPGIRRIFAGYRGEGVLHPLSEMK
jgi:hypothetical protein